MCKLALSIKKVVVNLWIHLENNTRVFLLFCSPNHFCSLARTENSALIEVQMTLQSLFSSEAQSDLQAITIDCQGKQLPNGFFKVLERNSASLQSVVLNNLPEDCRVCIYDLFRKLEFKKLKILEEFIAARTYKDECYIRLEETTCFPHTLNNLTLYGLGIVTIPECFAKFSKLTSLRLMNNIITSLLPLTTSNKSNALVELDVSENSLVCIPENIDQVSSLQVLNMSHNCIKKYLPSSIGNLKHLTKLSLEWNRLEEMPTIALLNLISLKYLNVSHNKIKSFSTLLCFHPSLQSLDLSGNEGLLFLREHHQTPPKKSVLLELDISSTGQETLPMWLPELKSLHILRADHNHIVDINILTNITTLQVGSFSYNHLEDCSVLLESLQGMPMLNMLDLSYNRLPQTDEADTVYIGEVAVMLQGNRPSVMQDSHDDYSSSVATSQLYRLSHICCCRRT